MNIELSSFASRLRDLIAVDGITASNFNDLALELFALQCRFNPAYQRVCESRRLTPGTVRHWSEVPFVPTSAFKELELSSIPEPERTAVFHSSGTTEQKPSRHFHCPESLAVYETSLWQGFHAQFASPNQYIFLTPPASEAPRSSLVHMFETVAKNVSGRTAASARFFGRIGSDGVWLIHFAEVIQTLNTAKASNQPVTILGTAFSFVHLLDHLAENNLMLTLPTWSTVMETGGYKNRSRTMPKAELHALITKYLGVPDERIICEYGMSELSSQAYDSSEVSQDSTNRIFQFPAWARAQIVSPETGREVADGETGLIRIFDLANVFSVAAIQTEDLAIRRGDGFELVGRAQQAEARGCSLMTT